MFTIWNLGIDYLISREEEIKDLQTSIFGNRLYEEASNICTDMTHYIYSRLGVNMDEYLDENGDMCIMDEHRDEIIDIIMNYKKPFIGLKN